MPGAFQKVFKMLTFNHCNKFFYNPLFTSYILNTKLKVCFVQEDRGSRFKEEPEVRKGSWDDI